MDSEESQCRDAVPAILLEEVPDELVYNICGL